MGDIEFAIGLARQIESGLSDRGAVGSGLREKAACFAQHLSPATLGAISSIAQERNRIAHTDGATLRDRAGYERTCRQILQAIQAIPGDARAEIVQQPRPSAKPKPLFEPMSPYADRQRRSAARAKTALVLGGIGAVLAAVFGSVMTGLFIAFIAGMTAIGEKYFRRL
jgi:hypothetical protein